jgi:hypothetical protein
VGIGIQALLTIVASLEAGNGLRDSNSSQSSIPQRPPAAIQEYMYIYPASSTSCMGCWLMNDDSRYRPTINFCFSSILSMLDKTCGHLTLLHSSKQAQGTVYSIVVG